MRSWLFLGVLLGLAGWLQAQEIKDPVLKRLVEKGIFTREEAVQMDQEILGLREEGPKEESEKVLGIFTKLDIEGLDYLGYTYKDSRKGDDSSNFEIRRGYFVTKAYFDKKNYLRMTLDVTTHYHKDDPNQGQEINAKFKHLYLYLDVADYLPYTGFEFGMVHTPWLDYEEHAGWWYRSVEKTFYEAEDAAHMLPSADLGIDFKTKTDYVSAEYGVFNGEGYDHLGRSDKGSKNEFFSNSLEGRVTLHVLGNGTKKVKAEKDQYLNVSLHGVDSIKHRGSPDDLQLYQVHAVFNMPMVLIAGQYVRGNWYSGSESDGQGYSFNADFRPIDDWAIFGRYDRWAPDRSQGTWNDRNLYIGGIAWTMNRYVKWILSGIMADYSGGSDPRSEEYLKYMLTAEVKW